MRAKIRAAARHHVQRFQQIAIGDFFQNEAASAGAHRAHDRILIVIHGKDHDFAFGMIAQDFGSGLDAVQSRQTNIHEDQLRPVQLHELQCVGAGFGFPDHAKFGIALQNGFDAIPHDLVVIHQQDVDRHIG